MQMLDIIQRRFIEAMISHDNAALDFISSQHKHDRLNIYRQTVYENLRNALEITFPGIWQLIGNDCANDVALCFCQDKAHLPVSGCLDDWGENFPKYLESIPTLKELPYLSDYGHYEWLKHLSAITPQYIEIGIDALGQYTQTQVGKLQLKLQPSLHFIYSPYPLWAIEELLEDPSLPNVSLDQGESWGMICCADTTVITFWLNKAEWQFIQHLNQGLTLEDACLGIPEEVPSFDLTKMFQLLFSTKSITAVKMKKG